MIEHRVRLRGRPRLRRYPDPAQSPDPRLRSLVAQLQAVGADRDAAPDQHFRAELRAQLVAVAPRIVAEGEPVVARPRPVPHRAAVSPVSSTADSPRAESATRRERIRIPIARPLAIVATMITVLGLVLGGAVWMSQDSVPGDALYGLKRASERFELSLADNDTERAQDHLDFARTRVEEARELAGRPSASGSGPLADGLSGETSNLIADALAAADGDTLAASQLLGSVAVTDGSGQALAPIIDWLPEQRSSLTQLWQRMPSGSTARAAALKSVQVVESTTTRAKALQQRAGCKCLSTENSDKYGPKPTTSSRPTTGSRPPATTQRPAQSNPGRTAPGGTTSGNPAPRTTPGAPSSTPTSKPGLRLPPLPLPTLLPQRSSSAPAGTTSPTCVINILGIKICR